MFVKPRQGLRLLRPDTSTQLLDCGEHVPDTSFWLRRLKDGDVIMVSPDLKPEVKLEKSKIKKSSKKQYDEIKLEGKK